MLKTRHDTRPWTQKLLSLLEDGEWQSYEEVKQSVLPEIPEAEALRTGERYRSYYYVNRGREVAQRKHGGVEETLKTGRNMILTNLVQDLSKTSRLEIEYEASEGKRRRIKLIRRVF